MKKIVMNFAMAVALVMSCAAAQAKSLSDLGEQLLDDYRHAVVEVQAVAKVNIDLGGMGKQTQEQQPVMTGTVLNKDGLIVTSYAALHPGYLVSSAEIPSQMGVINATITSETSNFQVRYADGTTVNAQLVLKDPEMDLAFLKPEKKAKTVQFVGNSKVGRFGVLERAISLRQGGKLSKFAPELSVERINAVVKKPSKMYLTEAPEMDAMAGMPVFNERGELVGISLIKGEPGAKVKGQMLQPNTIRVIRPIKEILAAAKQVAN